MNRQSVGNASNSEGEKLNAAGRYPVVQSRIAPVSVIRYRRQYGRIPAAPQFESVSGDTYCEILAAATDSCTRMPGQFEAQLLANMDAALATGHRAEFEWEFRKGERSSWNVVLVVPELSSCSEVTSVLAIISDITAHKEMELQLRSLARRRASDLENERRRIAHELHDDLGQLLIALRMSLALSARLSGGRAISREATDREIALVDTIIQSIRDVSMSLRPTMLNLGLIPALEWLTTRFSVHTGIRCRLQTSGCDTDMAEEQRIAIFRIAQESLTNAARHAKAEQIEIKFTKDRDTAVLEVRDNGSGFDTQKSRKPTTLGLVGMQERAIGMGGELVVLSHPQGGTVVRARFPLAGTAATDSREVRSSG
ncbi:sensor histidine kinase [Paraburkholderia sp.]|uniref:sensor histidine kinase n=1 Tax=Paraburkholderia sp. TaxID=1926495 RepID=UPI003C798650